MRFIILAAAAAAIASPALAQSSSSTGMDQSMQAPSGDPIGGYQPAHPALSGPVTPGTRIIYQQAPSPDQAYPAPPPLDHYPICKRGQYDHCRDPNSPK
ncbi:MAG: hypothetical protein B7Y45_11655 [Sphingomonas sp. 28-66-16]|nr:MAG: hypothetical protein B7Y45_11655 [Sphingomonas sp. 28-66-16]